MKTKTLASIALVLALGAAVWWSMHRSQSTSEPAVPVSEQAASRAETPVGSGRRSVTMHHTTNGALRIVAVDISQISPSVHPIVSAQVDHRKRLESAQML